MSENNKEIMPENATNSETTKPIRVSYGICFWLFMIANLVGAVIEGFYCLFACGKWETHVVTMWGPFCLLYGIGAVGVYLAASVLYGKGYLIEFIGYVLVGDGLELIGGALLEFGLGMYAWDYSSYFLNFHGYISLSMTIVWGLLGLAYARFCPLISKGLSNYEKGKFRIAIIVLSVFMFVNLTFTAICLTRWSNRHYGVPANSSFEKFLDEHYDDEYMQKRFIEWHFIA